MYAIAGGRLLGIKGFLNPEFGKLLAEGSGARMLHDDPAAQNREDFLIEGPGFGEPVGTDRDV